MMPQIIGIMASTGEGVVGANGGLPWHYPDEADHFRRTTQGHTVVMGLKTFKSMPEKLFTTRTPIVFSRSHHKIPAVTTVRDKQSFIHQLEHLPSTQPVYFIGGAELAHFFLQENLLSAFILTIINKNYAGDTVLDLQYLSGWERKTTTETSDYTIYRLVNPNKE